MRRLKRCSQLELSLPSTDIVKVAEKRSESQRNKPELCRLKDVPKPKLTGSKTRTTERIFDVSRDYEAATGSKIFRRGDGDSPPGTSVIQHQHPMIQHQHVCECL